MSFVKGFAAGLFIGSAFWLTFIFAPVAIAGDAGSDMSGRAIAVTVGFILGCGLIGAAIAKVKT